MQRTFLFFVMLFSFLPVHTTQAALTFYTDRTAWETAVTATILTEDFSSITPYFLAEGINSAGLINIELFNLVAQNELNAIDDGTGTENINSTPFYQGASNANNSSGTPSGADFIDILLPYVTTAFGGDFQSTHSGGGLTLSVDGTVYEFSDLLPDGTGCGFLGFISTEAFSTVRLYDAEKREVFGLDNVSFAIPEPATLALLGLGGLALLRKQK